MKLKKYKLGEIADINKRNINKSDSFKEIIYLDTSSITENIISNTITLNRNNAPSRAQRRVTNNTILYSTVRPLLKHYGILKKPQNNLIVSTGFATIDIKEEYKNDIDARFLYLLLTQPIITEYLANIAEIAVTAYPSITPSDIYSLSFNFPDINTQKKIADTWENYDQKIALNRKINDNLEAMAKQLYDYWFVQFDFPNEEGKPYKSSGGKMVWNEKLKREIPDGWEIKKVKEVLQHINTGLNPRDNFVFGGNIKYITVKNLTTNNYIDFSKCDTIDEEAHKKVHKRSRISSGDILYASICPLGRTYLITEEPIDWDINESVFSIRPNHNEITSEYLNMLLKDEYYIATLSNSSTGSIFLGIRIKQLEETHILLPQKDIQNIFSQKIKNIIQLQVNHFKQIESLTKQRDELLPLLMNGQVSVK